MELLVKKSAKIVILLKSCNFVQRSKCWSKIEIVSQILNLNSPKRVSRWCRFSNRIIIMGLHLEKYVYLNFCSMSCNFSCTKTKKNIFEFLVEVRTACYCTVSPKGMQFVQKMQILFFEKLFCTFNFSISFSDLKIYNDTKICTKYSLFSHQFRFFTKIFRF